MSSRFFDAQVERLRVDRRVIVPDLRGHGASEARAGTHTMERFSTDLHDLLEALDLRGVTLVGWSMGGGIAMRYVDRFGTARLAGVGLVDFPPRFEEAPGVADKVCDRLRSDRERFIRSFLRRMFVKEPSSDEVAWMLAEHNRCATETACEAYRQLGEGTSTGRTYGIPGLLVFPTQGWYRPALAEWTRIFPVHVEPTFDHSRHCPFIEEADAFAAAVRSFSAIAPSTAPSASRPAKA